MSLTLTSIPELNRRAFAILSRELGFPDTLRFFEQLGLGTGDYTQERRELFAGLTLEEYRAGLAQPTTDEAKQSRDRSPDDA